MPVDQVPNAPVRFQPEMEHVSPDEAGLHAELSRTLTEISETTLKHSGHATRGVHAKSHGVLRGYVRVLDGLPAVLAQGLFTTPGVYPVAMRLSTIPGDMLDDSVSAPRGLAIKILGVPGPRMAGSEDDTVQDFVLVNGPAFTAPNAEKFLGNLKLLASTTDKAPGLKKTASKVLRGVEMLIEAFGTKSPTVLTLGGQPETHILGDSFYSQAPILFGPYIAKLSVVPVSPELVALVDAPLDLNRQPDALRAAVRDHFSRHGGEWQIRVQLCTDLDKMPVEDASVIWPEEDSPYLPVARIIVDPQDSWSPQAVQTIDERMSFSPWHGLAAHRPLGSVMRARQSTYRNSAQFRASHNGCPIHQPRTAGEIGLPGNPAA